MNDISQNLMIQFIAEAKMIDGADNAIFELSEEMGNCLVLTGEIYEKHTRKINKLGREHGLIILLEELSVLYEKPR